MRTYTVIRVATPVRGSVVWIFYPVWDPQGDDG